MQTLLDHLLSILIGSVILLALAVTQMRSSHAGIEQVAQHGVKAKALVFGHWIERDVLDIGANMGRNRFRFLPPDTSASGNTVRFTFFSDSTIAGRATPLTVPGVGNFVNGDTLRLLTRYVLDSTRTVQLSDTTGALVTRQLYTVRREVARARVVNATAAIPPDNRWTTDRGTMGTMSFFKIGLLLRNGVETRDVEAADYLRVQFAVVPEHILNPENYLREMYWTTTLKIRPFWEPPPG